MREYAVGDEPVPGYQIIRPLGAGGYGTVWVAKSPGDVEIALKIINLQGQGLKEFRAIGLVKKLRHPNLIPIYAFWLKDDYGNFLDSSAQDSVNLRGKQFELIIAMGLGDMSLAQRLDECKKAFAQRHGLPDTDTALIAKVQDLGGTDLAGIPVEELLEYMFGSARAIDYLNQATHNLGGGAPSAIQHCDIKPGNLLIVSNDVQVCDYGLARVTDDARKTQAAGTPAYMAPELFANKPSSGTDQYSLAITYYELRTGKLPFDEQLAFHAHITGELDFALVTPAEQEILRRATHKRPAERFPHTLDMVRALREVLTPSRPAGTGVSYTPIPTPPPSGSSPPVLAPPSAQPPSGQPPSTPSGVYRSGSAPPAVAPTSSTPTIVSKPTVLDDLIRAGVELVPGHKLEQLLGRGGYGEVWSATMPGKTRCALKIVRNLDAVQGKQEFQSLDKIRDLDHDRLIRLQAYWVMAYDGSVIPDDQIGQPGAPKASALVVATDLAQQNLLQRWQDCHEQGGAGIAKEELVPYMRQSAEAIDYLNFQEPAIVHRDIKPENILLTKDRRVKVSDFGLAKVVEGSSAQINSASVGMTLAYAAPELFRNQVTRFTDQYSLAVTYYRLRVGKLPFEDGLGPIQMMQAHATGSLDFSGVGENEQAVLRRACAVDPPGRYGSCLEFAEALEIAAGLSRPMVSSPSVGQSHSVSPTAFAPGSGGRPGSHPAMAAKFGGQGPTDAGSNARETLRFNEPKTPSSAPSGWPQPTAAAADSGDFHIPFEPKRPGLPSGLMETTTNVPSAADVDTAPDGSRTGWRAQPAPGPTKSGGGAALIAAAVVLLIVAGGAGVYFFAFGGRTKTVDTGQGTGPVTDDLADLRAKAERAVATALADKNYPAAAKAVRDVAAKAGPDWAARQDGRIADGWRSFADAQPSDDQKRAEYGRILESYPDDPAVKTRLASMDFDRDNKKVAGLFAEALARLREGATADCRSKLVEAQGELEQLAKTGSSPEVQKLISGKRAELDDLNAALTDLDAIAAGAATEQSVVDLAKKVGAMRATSGPDEPTTAAIRGGYRRLLADKFRQVVPNLGAATKWEPLLEAARVAAPADSPTADPWAGLCRAECAAELTIRGQPAGSPQDRAVPALPDKAAPPLAAYHRYVAAVQQWAASPASKSAAQALAALAAEGPDVPAEQLNDYRRGRVLADLRTAAGRLRGGDAAAPFAGAAADAAHWLAAAGRLADKDSRLPPADRMRLKFDLALAYLAEQPPEPAKARPLAEELVSDAAQKQWQPSVPEQVQLWAAFARTREDDPAGRLAAVRADVKLFEILRDDLAGVKADYLYANLVRPLAENGGKQLLGDKPDRQTTEAAARLYFLAARNVRRYSDAWAAVNDLSERDRGQLVVRLFERAAEFDKKPAYVAWAGIAKSELPGNEAASAEGLTDESVPAVALLRGIALIGESVKSADLRARKEKWREADSLFRTGIERCGKRPEFRDERVLLYQRAANNCIQLANAVASSTEMSQYLDDAKGFADQLLSLDSGRLEVYDTRGCALEDMAWLRRDADRLAPTGKYAQAVADFTTATGGLGARAAAYMHLGRCQFKWAEDEFNSAPAAQRKLDDERLNTADASLDEVLNRAPESVEAAESHYWKARIQLLRYAADAGAAKPGLFAKAASEFKRAAGLAAKLKAAGWEEEVLKAWAVAALTEANRQVDAGLSGAADAIAYGVDRAEALKKLSPPWSAYLEMELVEAQERLRHTNLFERSLEAAKTGLGPCRDQDQPIQFLIRMKLVDLRTSILPSKSAQRKGAEALEDARAALTLAETAKLPITDVAQAHGALGLAWFYSSTPLKPSDRDKAKQELLEASRLAPDHWLAWKWKACLATIRSVDPVTTDAENATRLADTCRLYREAEESLAAREKSQGRLAPEEALYKGFIEDFRKKTEDLGRPLLMKQIADPTQAENPDRTRWQLAVAEILALHKTDLPTARKMFADAEKTYQRLPATEQAFYRSQIERIGRMLPKD